MTVRAWLCPTHGRQVTRLQDGPVARCVLCAAPMLPADPESKGDE